jgi:hypothetical protein
VRTPGAARAWCGRRRLAASSIGRVVRAPSAFVTSPEELFDEVRRRTPESEQRLHSVGQIVEGTMKTASHVVCHGSDLRSRPRGIGRCPGVSGERRGALTSCGRCCRRTHVASVARDPPERARRASLLPVRIQHGERHSNLWVYASTLESPTGPRERGLKQRSGRWGLSRADAREEGPGCNPDRAPPCEVRRLRQGPDMRNARATPRIQGCSS